MIPQTFTVTFSIGCFYFLVFLFYKKLVHIALAKINYTELTQLNSVVKN